MMEEWDEDLEVYCDDEGEEGVYIKLHGGACCGIKHIHSMGDGPDEVLSARLELTGTNTSYGRIATKGVNDAHADTYPEDFFYPSAPKETRLARLERILAFLKKERPNGIVEIVITTSQHLWYSPLERLGFVRVTEAINSNTGNRIVVFHLAY
jgi:hypothetical protein